jgi:hypothetical protein
MQIYIDNRTDSRTEVKDEELVEAFWASNYGDNVRLGMMLERALLSFLSDYGTFDISEPDTGYEALFDKVREAMPR